MPPTRPLASAPHDLPASSRASRAPRPLPLAREAFLAAARRDTPGTDLPRYTAVLDALLAWSAARPTQLAFRADAASADAIRFGRAGDAGVFWAARPTRGGAPTLEIAPPTGASLCDASRARVMATLNAHSRAVLTAGDRLRIGFGALKNAAALSAVLALLDDLLTAPDGTTDRTTDGATAGATDAPPAGT